MKEHMLHLWHTAMNLVYRISKGIKWEIKKRLIQLMVKHNVYYKYKKYL